MARAEDSPVDLRQRDMHRQIRRPEAAGRSAPRIETDAGEHDLHDRRIERIERRSLSPVEASGKGGGVEHDVKAPAVEKGAQAFERRLVLEARHEDARRRETLVTQRPGKAWIGATSPARYIER